VSINVREMACRPEDVLRVFADGWLYPVWVVGATRMRTVDDEWPNVGSRLEHSFGVWPFVINDETRVIEWSPPHRMVVQAKGWPLGEARVTLDAKPRGDGCVVRIEEWVVKGPGRLMPRPIQYVALHTRNTETLRRLAFVAERRSRATSSLTPGSSAMS
jgi:hypothetical protein